MSSNLIAIMPQGLITTNLKHNHIFSNHFCHTCSGPLKLGYPTQHHPLGRVACSLCQLPACNNCAFSTPILGKTGSDSSTISSTTSNVTSMQAPTATTAPNYAIICHNCGWSASIATEAPASKPVRVFRRLMSTVQNHKPKSSVEEGVDFSKQECSVCGHACCDQCVKLKRAESCTTVAPSNSAATTLCFKGKGADADNSADGAQIAWKQIHSLTTLPSQPFHHANRLILHIPAPSAKAHPVRKSSLRKPRPYLAHQIEELASDHPYTPAPSRNQSVEMRRQVKHVRFVTDEGILAKDPRYSFSDVCAMREQEKSFLCRAEGCDGKCNATTYITSTNKPVTSRPAAPTSTQLTRRNTTFTISPLTSTFASTPKAGQLFPVSPLPTSTAASACKTSTLPAIAITSPTPSTEAQRPALHRSNASASSFGSERRHKRNASSLITSSISTSTTTSTTTSSSTIATASSSSSHDRIETELTRPHSYKRTTTLLAEDATRALAAKIAIARSREVGSKGQDAAEGKPRISLADKGEADFAFGVENEMRTRGWGRLGVAGWDWAE